MNAIVWVLDSSDHSTFQTAQAELHALLDKPELRGIPLLVSQAALEVWRLRVLLRVAPYRPLTRRSLPTRTTCRITQP